jgi:hypothetical protein
LIERGPNRVNAPAAALGISGEVCEYFTDVRIVRDDRPSTSGVFFVCPQRGAPQHMASVEAVASLGSRQQASRSSNPLIS